MKVFQALQIQHVLDGRQIPSDMMDEHLVYYSESRGQFIRIVDMDVAHLVRAFHKLYQPNEFDETVSEQLNQADSDELKKLKKIESRIRNILDGKEVM
jgi:hypothetical protein